MSKTIIDISTYQIKQLFEVVGYLVFYKRKIINVAVNKYLRVSWKGKKVKVCNNLDLFYMIIYFLYNDKGTLNE